MYDRELLAEDGVNLTEIDGVPVLWTEGVGDPAATLSFRVGQADETLVTRGYTHLAEHVALSPFAHATFPINGSTALTVTNMFAAGDRDRLTPFITDTAGMLGRLTQSELSDDDRRAVLHDAKVLRAEQNTRSPDIVSATLGDLYGARSFGLVGWEELGLTDLSLDRFQAWVAQRFSRANAVLSLTYAPPGGLSLAGLANGAPVSPVPATPSFDHFPAYRRRNGPLALVAPVKRRLAASAFAAILQRALTSSLRHEAGSSYAPSVSYETISADEALLMVVVDSAWGHGTATTSRALGELDRLATQGPRPDELQSYRELVHQARQFEHHRLQFLSYAAEMVLYRGPIQSQTTTFSQIEELDGDIIRTVAAEVRAVMCVSIPGDADVQRDSLPALPEWSRDAVEGTTVSSRITAMRPTPAHIVLANDGVTLHDDDGRCTIRRDNAVALLRWDDGVDSLIGHDGMSIRLFPGRWAHESRIREHFGAMVGPDRIVRAGFRFGPPDTDPPIKISGGPGFMYLCVAVLVLLFPAMILAYEDLSLGLLAIPIALGLATLGVQRLTDRRLDSRQIYDDADWHFNSQQWRPDLPHSRAFVPGGLKLAWLADRGLLADWVEAGAAEHLAAYRAGEIDYGTLHRELGGVLASDMCVPEAARFFNWAHHSQSPFNSIKYPIDRWWNQLDRGPNPYGSESTPDLLARSHAWFDRTAKWEYRFTDPLAARRLQQACHVSQDDRGSGQAPQAVGAPLLGE